MMYNKKATITVRDMLPIEQYVFIEHMTHLFEGEKFEIRQRDDTVQVTLWKKNTSDENEPGL